MSGASRREFLRLASGSLAALAGSRAWPAGVAAIGLARPLDEFGYGDVTLHSELHEAQLRNAHDVLMSLSDDSMLKPLRKMAGQPAPGEELGGWYLYDPDWDYRKWGDGFAPACAFGQWVSALARYYAITRDPATRDRVLRLNKLYAGTISGDFYVNNRFPTYCYDKIVCGLIESHAYVQDPDAFAILERTTDAALPHFPTTAVEHDVSWRPGTDASYTWDESYTISENLFLAYQRGAGARYKQLGVQYLDDIYYGPLAEGRSNLSGRHAYSHVNSLCSAMQAYLTTGSETHFRAASNGFDFVAAQSYATGGWGPDELLRAPGSADVADSLRTTHHSFETPCGAYAHFKLTRYLLRVTRDSRYGDSMERVMYNTILGAKPLAANGDNFYYSDYNFEAQKVYHDGRWACCSGTYPQIAADYRISAYFRDADGVYVNLYIPSKVAWLQDRAPMALELKTNYPMGEELQFFVTAARAREFALRFRIPAWAEGAELSVNEKGWRGGVAAGSFAEIKRKWKNGDRVQLRLPRRNRLEAIDQNHPDTVALLSGPLVLFGIDAGCYRVTRAQLLGARQSTPGSWQAKGPDGEEGALQLKPFFAIDEERYTTYFQV